jgi:S1-C subfamily serine protease
LGDYIFSVPQSDRSYFPVLGIRGSLNNNQFVISKVNNGSIAEKNGIKKGDIIISINGNKMTSIEQLRLLMLKKNWNDLIGFKIIKNIKIEK